MAKRKKRARKSIESLEYQIILHEEKRAKAKTPELRRYYDREIATFKEVLERKKRIAGYKSKKDENLNLRLALRVLSQIQD